jgi:protein O-GlcNAc transferase
MMNMSTEQLQGMKQQALNLLRSNRLAEAQALFSQICAQNSDDVEAWHLLSSVYGMQGKLDEAGNCCRRVIALRPEHSEAHVNLGNVLFCQGKLEDAVAHYQTAVRIDPNNAGALCSLGNALSSMNKHREATANYQAALRLNPNFAEAHYNLGNTQMALQKYDDAVTSFQHAIRINPNYAAAYNNLGNAHKERGDISAAIVNYRAAVRLQPDFARAYNNLAIVLKEQGMLQDAYEAAQQALRAHPDFADAYISLGNISIAQGRPNRAIEYFQRLLNIQPNHSEAHTCLFTMMHYRPEYSADQLFTVAQEWGVRYTPQIASLPPPANSPDPQRRLRVGYVSGDFYQHPVGYFIESVFAHHDGAQFETFCYYNHDKYDELTTRLQGAVHHWRNIAGQSDENVLQKIRDDGIDLLIDLSGHTDRNRLLVFAHKPAPVQVTWLGYFDTTGLSAIDYIIGDRFLIPPQEEAHYVERVLRLPKAYLCYSPPADKIDPGPLPALATGHITFGCFNNTAKLTEEIIACWSRLLHAVPQAHLYLKYKPLGNDGVRYHYQTLFAAQGIDIARIRLAGASPRQEYLAAYREVDISLDPFPFNGCTTTMESLWMGVPVISLRGDRYVSHMGETILKHLDLEDFVTDSQEGYIAKAVALTTDLHALAEMRQRLRSNLLNSCLCDGPGFTRSLEAVYRDIWVKWCHEQGTA